VRSIAWDHSDYAPERVRGHALIKGGNEIYSCDKSGRKMADFESLRSFGRPSRNCQLCPRPTTVTAYIETSYLWTLI